MDLKSRKFYVWLISAGAIIIIYLLYNLISSTPAIKIDTPETTSEGDAVEFDSKIGKVGDVGIGPIQKARYTHLDVKKRVDREFGFEKLLHAEENAWEIEKPYMNIFRHNLKCYMTADKGTVRVEDAVGRATPTDATLIGNVVIHILPEKKSGIKESFIYLDDVIFLSEKSQFSTAGPVKFISSNAQMHGKGMEIVYNDELERLEFLKIINLESLRIRQSSKTALFSSGVSRPQAEQASSAADPASQTQTDQQEIKETPVTGENEVKKEKGEYYKCVFRKNVIIDCPEQVILTDEISVNDILWSKGPEEKPESLDASDTNRTEVATEVPKESAVSSRDEPNESPEKLVEIVITCDNGIAVVPMDSPILTEDEAPGSKDIKSFIDDKGRPIFIAQRIDYSLITEAVVATKPSELTFYANDIMGTDGTRTAVPVKITAQEKAAFLPKLNQVIFEGDVVCSALRENIDFQQKYTLSAPKLVAELSKDKQSRADIKHLTASGKVVQLDTSKWAGEKLLGFTKLKCPQFDYDTGQRTFLATGPGIIAADNSKIAESGKKVGKFSLQRPCTAIVQNFDTLKYSTKTNIVIADGGSEQIRIDYFPVVKGRQEQQTTATANRIEAVLYETAAGQTELSTLSAKGGINYKEQSEKKGTTVQFIGSEMFYDGGKSLITAWGNETQPCFLNGALAPGIEYDLKNDRIKTSIIGPGMIPMGN
ncbi:MAG: LPS export ABC transporter periplasmic protein LptC [Sedimentisphaerales bacterium]|nr:LPS export ABC transporter periplasmic protein LptC [Sedimentisphaerales bacterium]